MTSGYSSDVRAIKPLAVLQAFVDDSATDDGEQRLFLAGYINTADKWVLFSDAWKEALQLSPPIEYFKMSEANSLNGQFYGWSVPDKDAKILALARVIRHFKPASIHCSISRRDVKSLMKGKVPYGFADPYGYVFSGIMVPLAHQQIQRDMIRVPIDFIFDEQENIGEEAKFWYKQIRDMQPKAVKDLLSIEPLFRNDKNVMPLQAADMLAWHIRRQHEKGDPKAWFVPDYLATDGHHIALDFDLPRLQSLAEQMMKVEGVHRITGKTAWKKARKEVERSLAAGYIPPHGTRWKNFIYGARKRLARFFRL
jgi:hypothetical protein